MFPKFFRAVSPSRRIIFCKRTRARKKTKNKYKKKNQITNTYCTVARRKYIITTLLARVSFYVVFTKIITKIVDTQRRRRRPILLSRR